MSIPPIVVEPRMAACADEGVSALKYHIVMGRGGHAACGAQVLLGEQIKAKSVPPAVRCRRRVCARVFEWADEQKP